MARGCPCRVKAGPRMEYMLRTDSSVRRAYDNQFLLWSSIPFFSLSLGTWLVENPGIREEWRYWDAGVLLRIAMPAMPHIYPVGVIFSSPGSRSAPWVRDGERQRYPNGVPQL